MRLGSVLAGNLVGGGSGPVLTTAVLGGCATEPSVVESNFFAILYGSVGGFALLTWILVPPSLPWLSDKRDPKS